MKLLLPALGCALGCSALLASIQVSAQNKARVPISSPVAPPNVPPKAGPQRMVYANRFNTAYNDLKPLLNDVLITFDAAQGSLKTTRTRPASGDDFSKLKTDLLAAVAKARPSLKRLRAISSIPRSLKRADTNFVDGTLELDLALDTLVLWSDHPINEWKLRANRLLRKGQNDLDLGQIKLLHLTDPPLVGKVYVDG